MTWLATVSGKRLALTCATAVLASGVLGSCASSGLGKGPDTSVSSAGSAPVQAGQAHYDVHIVRTADGVPHITASDWPDLGYGYGYMQGRDNLCSMAQGFVTYRGERSRFLGADATLPDHSTLGKPKNIDSDFFFKLMVGDDVVNAFGRAQPAALQRLTSGFVAGYNRYVEDIKAGNFAQSHAACRQAAWVREITTQDVYRRLYTATLPAGYGRFITEIATAHPPGAAPSPGDVADLGKPRNGADRRGATPLQLADDKTWIGGKEGVGSNGMAFGPQVTQSGQPILLGNPHWFWQGPDRFYQAHLTIPGTLDVAGVSFLGVPVIVIGYNHNVAWTHTVSTARRFGVFELTLQKDQPTKYLQDGAVIPMKAVPLDVQVLQKDGTERTVHRTLYLSKQGPLVDLSRLSAPLGWSKDRAFAMRDVNAANFRAFSNFLAWDQASSLDDFVSIQKKMAATPWVNTIAIGRNDSRVWYADIGAVPNVPDTLAAACTTPLGKRADQMMPGIPFLDGSRSSCDWVTDSAAVQPGAFAAASMPGLFRSDYVANMNNSYWLANPDAPLEGFPAIFGEHGKPISLRTRLGLQLARQYSPDLHAPSGSPHGTDQRPGDVPGRYAVGALKVLALNSRALSAELFKAPLLAQVCVSPTVTVTKDLATGATFAPPKQVEIRDACRVLIDWDNTGREHARGAGLWDAVWARVAKIDAARLYATGFAASDPLDTPRGLKPDYDDLSQALGAAVLAVQQSGYPLDAERGETVYVAKSSAHIPLYGGCDAAGYFTSVCVEAPLHKDVPVTDGDIIGNSYLQVVTFTQDGADAYTLLSHSQSDDPASPFYADATRQYSQQQWQHRVLSTHGGEAGAPQE